MGLYVALLFSPGTTCEEVHAAVDNHFANPGAPGSGNRQSVIIADPNSTHVAQPLPNAGPSAAQAFGNPGAPPAAASTPALPVTTAPPPAAATGSYAQLDKDGLPWDERIHSSNKEMTDKGVWRKRRGVSNETIAKVSVELRNVLAAQGGTAATAPPAPAAATTGVPIPAEVLAAMDRGETVALTPEQVAYLQQQAGGAAQTATGGAVPALSGVTVAAHNPPPLPGSAVPPPLPNAGPTPEQLAYQALVTLITANLAPNGRLTEEWVQQVVAHFGVTSSDGKGSVALLLNRPDVVKTVHEYIAGVLAG